MFNPPTPKVLVSIFVTLIFWGFLLTILSFHDEISEMDPSYPTDFTMYLTGAKMFRDGKTNKLYDIEEQKMYRESVLPSDGITGILAFRTPPITAALYSLLPLHDYKTAFWVNGLINIALIIVSISLLTKNFNSFLEMSFLAVFNIAVLTTLVNGQITGLILLILVFEYILLKKEKSVLAGIFGALLFVKPHFLILIPFFLLLNNSDSKKFKYLLSFAITMLIILIFNTALYGTNFIPDYIQYVLSSEGIEYGTRMSSNTNITSLVDFLSGGVNRQTLATALSFAAYILLFGYFLKYTSKLEERFALSILIIPLVNIHTLHSDLLVWLIPLAYFLTEPKFKAKIWKPMIILLFILIPNFSYWEKEWFVALCMLVFSVYLLIKLRSDFRAGEKPQSSFLVEMGGIEPPCRDI